MRIRFYPGGRLVFSKPSSVLPVPTARSRAASANAYTSIPAVFRVPQPQPRVRPPAIVESVRSPISRIGWSTPRTRMPLFVRRNPSGRSFRSSSSGIFPAPEYFFQGAAAVRDSPCPGPRARPRGPLTGLLRQEFPGRLAAMKESISGLRLFGLP